MIESGKLKIQIHKVRLWIHTAFHADVPHWSIFQEFALSDINAAFLVQQTHRSIGKNILIVNEM